MATCELISERFSLRPVVGEDVQALHDCWTNEQVRRFLWDGEVIPLAQTRGIVEKSRALFGAYGFGIWGVRALDSEDLLGFAGYWHFRDPPTLELLFGVGPGHWGRGIATEIGHSLIRYAFRDLSFDAVYASTDFANTGSLRVLEKLGLPITRRDIVDDLDTVFFTLTRDEWDKGSATRAE